MTTAFDRAQPSAPEPGEPPTAPAAELPPLTPETARQLAALLAPHLTAMRAVLAGTRYEFSADGESAGDTPGVSPATRIFIAGMLQRLQA